MEISFQQYCISENTLYKSLILLEYILSFSKKAWSSNIRYVFEFSNQSVLLYVKLAYPDGLFMSFQLQCVCLGQEIFEPSGFVFSKQEHVSSRGHSWWLFKVVSIRVKEWYIME